MKKWIIIFLAMLMVCLATGCGKEEKVSKEEHIENEMDAEAVAVEDPVIITPQVTYEESYGILKRAGAGQSVFLEEDISSLIEEARNNPQIIVAQDTGTAEQKTEDEEAKEVVSGDEISENTPDEETEEGEDDTANVQDTVQPSTGGGRIVCIDAGHQRKQNSAQEPIGPGATTTKMKVTSGTSGSTTGVPEYQLTLAVALKLQSVLQQRGYSVVMCRSSHDVDISNSQRAQMANEAGAGAFIRIHADGSTNASAAGACTLAPSSSNPYCGSIAPASQTLSNAVINAYCAKTGVKNRGMQINDNMSGLNWSQVPVTIIEMGFMTNPAEDQLMQTESFQQAAAEGMADGIDAFFAGR